MSEKPQINEKKLIQEGLNDLDDLAGLTTDIERLNRVDEDKVYYSKFVTQEGGVVTPDSNVAFWSVTDRDEWDMGIKFSYQGMVFNVVFYSGAYTLTDQYLVDTASPLNRKESGVHFWDHFSQTDTEMYNALQNIIDEMNRDSGIHATPNKLIPAALKIAELIDGSRAINIEVEISS